MEPIGGRPRPAPKSNPSLQGSCRRGDTTVSLTSPSQPSFSSLADGTPDRGSIPTLVLGMGRPGQGDGGGGRRVASAGPRRPDRAPNRAWSSHRIQGDSAGCSRSALPERGGHGDALCGGARLSRRLGLRFDELVRSLPSVRELLPTYPCVRYSPVAIVRRSRSASSVATWPALRGVGRLLRNGPASPVRLAGIRRRPSR
jgi:hypothetical protein